MLGLGQGDILSVPYTQCSIKNHMLCGLVYDGLDCVEVGGPIVHLDGEVEFDRGVNAVNPKGQEGGDNGTPQQGEEPAANNDNSAVWQEDGESQADSISGWRGHRYRAGRHYAERERDQNVDDYSYAQELLAKVTNEREEWKRAKGSSKGSTTGSAKGKKGSKSKNDWATPPSKGSSKGYKSSKSKDDWAMPQNKNGSGGTATTVAEQATSGESAGRG